MYEPSEICLLQISSDSAKLFTSTLVSKSLAHSFSYTRVSAICAKVFTKYEPNLIENLTQLCYRKQSFLLQFVSHSNRIFHNMFVTDCVQIAHPLCHKFCSKWDATVAKNVPKYDTKSVSYHTNLVTKYCSYLLQIASQYVCNFVTKCFRTTPSKYDFFI